MVPCTLLKSLIAGNSIYSKTLETSSPSNLPLTHHPLPSFPPCLTPHNTPQHTPTTRRALKLEWAAASYKHTRQTHTTHRPHRREAKEESKVPLYICIYIQRCVRSGARRYTPAFPFIGPSRAQRGFPSVRVQHARVADYAEQVRAQP